jgi:hypothetical protein
VAFTLGLVGCTGAPEDESAEDGSMEDTRNSTADPLSSGEQCSWNDYGAFRCEGKQLYYCADVGQEYPIWVPAKTNWSC